MSLCTDMRTRISPIIGRCSCNDTGVTAGNTFKDNETVVEYARLVHSLLLLQH